MTAGFSLRWPFRTTTHWFLCVLRTTAESSELIKITTSAERALTFLQLYDKHCNFQFCSKWGNQIYWCNGRRNFLQTIKLEAPKTSGRNSVHLTSSPTSVLSHFVFFHQEITKDSSNLKLLFRKRFFLRQNHQNEQREAAFPGRLHQETPCKSTSVPVDACNYCKVPTGTPFSLHLGCASIFCPWRTQTEKRWQRKMHNFLSYIFEITAGNANTAPALL